MTEWEIDDEKASEERQRKEDQAEKKWEDLIRSMPKWERWKRSKWWLCSCCWKWKIRNLFTGESKYK